ncbi:hypothetical protein LZ31DRAFT_376779 [Colletotrichum somersetense]|nr:hypothetical protein LZ31DRAFT_376779 [Colletotrichum somersetense]
MKRKKPFPETSSSTTARGSASRSTMYPYSFRTPGTSLHRVPSLRSVYTRELSTTRKLTPVCAVFCLIRRPEAVQPVPVQTQPAQPRPDQAIRAAYEPHTNRMAGIELLLPCRASTVAQSATEENGAGCIHCMRGTTCCQKKKMKKRDKVGGGNLPKVMVKDRYKKD